MSPGRQGRRPTERGDRRREQLVEAAADLLAEEGFAAVTHRAVARRAALPPASTTYYFASREEVVAEALARLGHTGRPAAFLAETLDTHESPRVRLLALDALTYVGVAALPHLAVIQRAAESSDQLIRNAGRYLNFVLTGTYTPSSPVFGGF